MVERNTLSVNPVQRDRAKEILLVLDNAISAAKLFPPDHQTVVNFVANLHERLSEYLDEYWKLELGIEEHAFTLGDERVFEDPHPVKSVPFLFFKDGMQQIYFYKGLTRDELRDFLVTIRTVAQLPPEEGDIVNALWEKDFANIRYLAPDDFLETRIGVGRRSLRPAVDRESLSQGRIELAPEDLEEMNNNIRAQDATLSRETGKPVASDTENRLSQTASSGEAETREIEMLLQSSRQSSPEDEYLNLVMELVYLEDRTDQFPAIVDVLERYLQDIMKKKDFTKAAALVRNLYEIRDSFSMNDRRKSELISSVISLLTRKSVLVELQDKLDLSSVQDMNGLFDCLKPFGSQAAGLLADIYEQARNTEWREAALQLLTKIGRDDIQALGDLIQESRPAVSQEVIRLLIESQDRRIVAFLANVVSCRNPAIKQAAIRALGALRDEAANKILLGFLSDADEEVRIAALENLKKTEDKQTVSHLVGLVSEKKFAKKSAGEKKALFDSLGRSDSEEACEFLARILGKVPFLPNPKHTILCLYAVSALREMKQPGSLEILQEGSKRRNLKIRSACQKAIQAKLRDPTTLPGRILQ